MDAATDFFCDFTRDMAEQVTKAWASFDQSPERAQIRERLRVAIGQAIVKELTTATQREMRGEGAKW